MNLPALEVVLWEPETSELDHGAAVAAEVCRVSTHSGTASLRRVIGVTPGGCLIQAACDPLRTTTICVLRLTSWLASSSITVLRRSTILESDLLKSQYIAVTTTRVVSGNVTGVRNHSAAPSLSDCGGAGASTQQQISGVRPSDLTQQPPTRGAVVVQGSVYREGLLPASKAAGTHDVLRLTPTAGARHAPSTHGASCAHRLPAAGSGGALGAGGACGGPHIIVQAGVMRPGWDCGECLAVGWEYSCYKRR